MAIETDKRQRKIGSATTRRLLFGAAALLAYVVAYYPSWRVPFRVEEFDIYHFYATTPFDPLDLRDWGRMAFWTPFYDFRMLPLAYLWNFGVFELLGTSSVAHWALSMALDLTNAGLLAYWVSLRFGKNATCGLIAAAVFLLFPAKHEIVIWSFFTYKLVHTTLVLAALIGFEKFFRTRRQAPLVVGLGLLFLSWLFYEASLLLGLAVLLGLWLEGRPERRQLILATSWLAGFYAVYAGLHLLAQRYAPDAYGLLRPGDSSFIQPRSIPQLWVSFVHWLSQGILLANSGLPLITDTTSIPTSIAVQVRTAIGWGAVIATAWLLVGSQIRWRAIPWRAAIYLLGCNALLGALVLVGRTATNGTDYLAHFSMYQYLPSLGLAALIGGAIDISLTATDPPARLANPRRLLLATGAILVLLGWSSGQAVRGYVDAQRPLMTLLEDFAGRCATPDAHASVANVVVPFTPNTLLVPPEEHAYNALSLLYGDCILAPSSADWTSAILREEPLDVRVRRPANFDNWIKLLGYDAPAAVIRGRPFRMTVFFGVARRVSQRYRLVMQFESESARFESVHEPIRGSYNPTSPNEPLEWPTELWHSGDFIRDVFEVTPDVQVPPGTYVVYLAFARVSGGVPGDRLPVLSGSPDSTNRVALGTLQVR